MKAMNEKTVEVLREIHHQCEGVYTEFDQLYKQIGTDEQIPLDKETLQSTLALVACAFSSLSDYLKWYSDVEVEYTSETDRETELTIELEQEKAKSNAVEGAMGELMKERGEARAESARWHYAGQRANVHSLWLPAPESGSAVGGTWHSHGAGAVAGR